MKRLDPSYNCPVELTLEFIGGKWKTVILAWLKQGPLRYSELRRKIPGVSDKVLSQRLRDLEELGLVTRALVEAEGQSQHHVWRMTERAEGLRPALGQLYEWGLAMASELSIEIGQPSE